jgi:hypothetical protein
MMAMSFAKLAGLLLATQFAASAAHAFCSPFGGLVRAVGDVASDSNCTDNDIQSAIDAIAQSTTQCPATINVTREHTYTAQHLTISNTGKTINIVGQGDGVACSTGPSICIGGPCYTSPQVTISGSGHSGDSVLHIDGNNNVTLQFLSISFGSLASNQGGGGIYFNGSGSLKLDTSVVSFNTAGYGGGIDFIGSGGDATLTLLPNSLILSNTALVDGGGVRVEGSARFFALQDQTMIAFNHAADGHGGGLDVIAPARADVGSSGYNGLGVIYDNDAAYGGGVSVNDGGNNGDTTAQVRFFTTNAQKPVRLSANNATALGGAMFLQPFSSTFPTINHTQASACLFNFLIDDNNAPDGGAIFLAFSPDVSGDKGSILEANILGPDGQENPCGPETTVALGAVACAPGVTCNEISANTAEDNTNQPSGAVVAVQESFFLAHRLIMQGNVGINAVNGQGSGATVYVDDCLITGNHTRNELFSVHDAGSAAARLYDCTVAGNTIDNGYVIASDSDFAMLRDIIDQPGHLPYDHIGGALTAQYILANDITGLPPGTLQQGEALFLDAANGDYHLQPISLGVDFAPVDNSVPDLKVDLDGKSRNVDLIQIANGYGPRDIGAYERQSYFTCGAADTLFCNGFEQ